MSFRPPSGQSVNRDSTLEEGAMAAVSAGWADRVRWPAVQDSPSTITPDAAAFEGQFEQHRAELCAYCYRMLGSPFEAEDAVQETFIRAWRGLGKFEGRAELLDTSVASVNSALQRARATLEESNLSVADTSSSVDEANAELLARYVRAFEQYDMDALTSLIQEDATQSMPPFDLWLSGRDDILSWWVGPGAGCRGSRVIPTVAANGSPAFGQYKPSDSREGYDPWALQVLEISDGRIVEFTFFLDTERVFPLFGLPLRLEY